MPIIDAQVHAYERDHPGRPWVGPLHGPPEVTGDDMVAAMDAVGVDGALLVSPYAMYRFDASYALEAYAGHPDRFAVIKPVDPADPDVAQVVDEWAETPGAVGVRLMIAARMNPEPDEEGLSRVARAAAVNGLPVNVLAWGRLDMMGRLAAQHPECQFVIDHLGIQQPFEPPVPAEPFKSLPAVLELARSENVAIKITGACTLSRQGAPFDDIWDAVGQLLDAYGVERCLWGTDWTRATELITYADGVEAFTQSRYLADRLDSAERALLMGGTLERIYRWAPGSR